MEKKLTQEIDYTLMRITVTECKQNDIPINKQNKNGIKNLPIGFDLKPLKWLI